MAYDSVNATGREMEEMDYRHEVKHVITAGDAAAIRTNMSAVAHLDPHAGEKGYYRIRSLYLAAVLIIRKGRRLQQLIKPPCNVNVRFET